MGGGDERVGLENRLEAGELVVRVGGRPVEDERVAVTGLTTESPARIMVSLPVEWCRQEASVFAPAFSSARRAILSSASRFSAQGCQPPG